MYEQIRCRGQSVAERAQRDTVVLRIGLRRTKKNKADFETIFTFLCVIGCRYSAKNASLSGCV